jgi:hypothetical protein
LILFQLCILKIDNCLGFGITANYVSVINR